MPLVEAPDGRVWSVRLAWHRVGSPKTPVEAAQPHERALRTLLRTPFAGIVLAVLDWYWWVFGPFLELFGRRPWYEAISANPWIVLIWRGNGRRGSQATVREIAAALADGHERPLPAGADFVGYGKMPERPARRRPQIL